MIMIVISILHLKNLLLKKPFSTIYKLYIGNLIKTKIIYYIESFIIKK